MKVITSSIPTFERRLVDVPSAIAKVHANGGEWRVEKQAVAVGNPRRVRTGGAQEGIPLIDDFNTGDNFGVSYFEVNQKDGWRWNTSKAFLRPIKDVRPNLTIWTHSQVKKLIIDRNPMVRCAVRALRLYGTASWSLSRLRAKS